MHDAYVGREQTAAKHFILRRYLQSLANKLLHGNFTTLTYVDGFSGPWESKTSDFSDTSFKIAIDALKDAQLRVRDRGMRKRVQCFFVEEKPSSYAELVAAVAPYNDPANDFQIHTFNGRFENAIDRIMDVVGRSFALTFIDPTGWTGYEFHKIGPLMRHAPGEVLLNFMFDFINRFTASDDPRIVASFDGILGKDWLARLDPTKPRDEAVQSLFASEFRAAGNFKYVLSTPIEKLSDRTHFCIVYGTRSDSGLDTYRDVEFAGLRDHGMRRLEAKLAREEERTGIVDLFSASEVPATRSIENQVHGLCQEAREWLLTDLRGRKRPCRFVDVWPPMLANFTIRKTNAKDICVQLARDGFIRASWKDRGPKIRTPDDNDAIELLASVG